MIVFLDFLQANRTTDVVLHNDFSWTSFISFAAESMRDLPPKHYGFLLLLFGGILSYLTKTCAPLFDTFQAEKTTNTPESLLTLEGAFYAFFPQVAHITGFIMCWIITFILILPLRFAPQIFSGLLWLCSTIIYFVELVQKTSASGLHVAFGDSFKLHVFWFVIAQAFGFSFIIGLMVFLIVYLSWKFFHNGHTRAAEVGLNDVLSLAI